MPFDFVRKTIPFITALVLGGSLIAAVTDDDFQFALMGDRTGETVPGVWEQVWRETSAEKPAFVVTAGDTIQGLDDKQTDAEWKQALQFLSPFTRRFDIYFTPGNHDVWSEASAAAYERYTKRPLHYGFDYHQAHFTVLNDHDNSATAPLASDELAFLESDLKENATQPLKFVVSHRPFWIFSAAMRTADSAAQRIATQYGVEYFIAGHIHQMLHFSVNGIEYISLPSAGGHLRLSKAYKDGWFFGHSVVHVKGGAAQITIEEARPPFGEGRITKLSDWTAAGLAASTK